MNSLHETLFAGTANSTGLERKAEQIIDSDRLIEYDKICDYEDKFFLTRRKVETALKSCYQPLASENGTAISENGNLQSRKIDRKEV